jgi:hypothetical protein
MFVEPSSSFLLRIGQCLGSAAGERILDQDDFIAKVKNFLPFVKGPSHGRHGRAPFFCRLRGRKRKLVKALCVEKLSITLVCSELA